MPNLHHDKSGKFSHREDPPLVSLIITSPVIYLKKWWQKVIGNEGMDIRIKIHPLTFLAAFTVISLSSFSLGRVSIYNNLPFIKYLSFNSPSPTPNPDKPMAETGTVRFSQTLSKYYLETATQGTIALEIPQNISLEKFVGRRILVSGTINTLTNVFTVTDASDLELLPATPSIIPTTHVSATPVLTPGEIVPQF